MRRYLSSKHARRRYNYENAVGQRFGMLTVVEQSTKFYHGGSLWECRCDCGEMLQRPVGRLRTEADYFKRGIRKTPPACAKCVRKYLADRKADGTS